MEIKVIGQSPTELEELEQRDEAPIGVEGADSEMINTIVVHQVLDLDESGQSKYESEVKTILEWAKQNADSDDHTAIKWAIRDLQMRIGTPTHEDRIKHLARFAYLDLEEKRIKKAKQSFV